MTKEEFSKNISLYKKAEEQLNKYSELQINLFETDMIQNYETLIDNLWKEAFTKEGVDWISWFLFEKYGTFGDLDHDAFDKDGNVIPTDTPEELYDNILKDYLK